jgi:hypothetical protein
LSVSVRFGFLLIKPKPNRTEPACFFKNLIGFFFGSVFSVIFFWFSRFNRFSGFFAHPYLSIIFYITKNSARPIGKWSRPI